MSATRPYEIVQLAERLHRDFDNFLPEAPSGKTDEREKNFLSRALAAYVVHKLGGCSIEAAADSIVDGSEDGGIDAVHYSPASNTLWLVQSKYIQSGRGEPDLSEVGKFKNGIEHLMNGRFEVFENNSAWRDQLQAIRMYFDDPALRVRAALVYSGIHTISDDRLRLFEDLKRRFSSSDDYFEFSYYNLTTCYNWVIGTDEDAGVHEAHLELLYPGMITQPYETVYGMVRISDIAALHREHGNRLIAANIRGYKGETEVNNRISATIRDEPDHLVYLNNGLTAYCENLNIRNTDRANHEKKQIAVRGFSIVNGAQTLGSIRSVCDACEGATPDGFVFMKIISLERCEDNITFARRITESTNFQNRIGARDFAAQDEMQKRIAYALGVDGITYSYKDAQNIPPPDETHFDLVEATEALACLEHDDECTLYACVAGDMDALWSFEEIYPNHVDYHSQYQRIFQPKYSGRTIWRAVQTRRVVLEQMRAEQEQAHGLRRAFFEQARWLVLNIVFLKLYPVEGEVLTLQSDERNAISDEATEAAEAIWRAAEEAGYVRNRGAGTDNEQYEQDTPFQEIFRDAAACQRLRNGALAVLNAKT